MGFPRPEAVRRLFDEPVSEELIELLGDLFPGSLHVRLIGAGGAPDSIIWELARERDCLLVTKDEDVGVNGAHFDSAITSTPLATTST